MRFPFFQERPEVAQPQGLIEALLNSEAPFGDRHDAAMDLGMYDEAEAEAALLAVACDTATARMLAEECEGSLVEIWARRREFNASALSGLSGETLLRACKLIAARMPEWREHVESVLRGGATPPNNSFNPTRK